MWAFIYTAEKLGPETLSSIVKKHKNYFIGRKSTSLKPEQTYPEGLFGRLGTSFSAEIIIQNGAEMEETLSRKRKVWNLDCSYLQLQKHPRAYDRAQERQLN